MKRTFAVIAVTLGSLAANAHAIPTKWESTHQSGATGTYTEIVNAATDRSAGSGYGNVSDSVGNFIDFFDDTDTLEFQDVAINHSGFERLALQSRADDRFHRVTLELFDSTQGTASAPLHTFTVDRFRTTSWGGGQTVFSGGLDIPQGTYDIRLTSVLDAQGDGDAGSANEGSHFFGLGTYVAPNILTSSPAGDVHLLETTDAWILGGSPQANTNRDQNATGNEWMDSLAGTGQYIDWEVLNLDADTEFTFSVRYRSGHTEGFADGQLFGVADDGEVTLLASVQLPPTGAWDGLFIDSATSSTFAIPEGFAYLRFQEIGVGNNGITHLDYIQLNAVAPTVPEPATAMLGMIGLAALAARRRRNRIA